MKTSQFLYALCFAFFGAGVVAEYMESRIARDAERLANATVQTP